MKKDFITVTPDSNSGNGEITIVADQNTGINRSTIISVSGGGQQDFRRKTKVCCCLFR